MRAELWLQVAAYATWIVCGVPGAVAVLEGRMAPGRSWIWAAAFLAFGAAYTACGGGIVAAELPFVFGARATFAWMVAQSLLVGALFWSINGPMMAIVGGGAFAGFQMFAVSTAWLTRSESLARQALARTNAELTATRE